MRSSVKPHRAHPLWFAYMLHRVSGLVLVLFLPVHFYLLSLTLSAPRSLDNFLHWSQHPMVKLAEFGLVFLLALHMFGGLRLLMLEWLPITGRQKSLIAATLAASFLISLVFLLRAI